MKNTSFNLLLSGVPYQVKAEPFSFNTETRFRVSYNSGPESIFAWDAQMLQFKALDDENDVPPDLEQAISDRLRENMPA